MLKALLWIILPEADFSTSSSFPGSIRTQIELISWKKSVLFELSRNVPYIAIAFWMITIMLLSEILKKGKLLSLPSLSISLPRKQSSPYFKAMSTIIISFICRSKSALNRY